MTAPVAPTSEPPATGGRVWLVLAGVVLLLMIAIGALVLTSGKRAPPVASGPTEFQERRLSARLDQVESDILGGSFERARTDLDIAESESVEIPSLRSRAGILRQRLRVAMTLATAQQLEQEGQVEAALGAYSDVLVLDSSHAEARGAVARLRAPTPAVAATRTPPRPKPTRPDSRPVERPAAPVAVPTAPPVPKPEPKVEPKPAPKPDDGLLLPTTKPKDDSIFLPVGGTR